MTPIDKPLPLGEILAQTVEVYRERIWAALGVGSFLSATLLIARAAPDWADITILSLALTACYAASSRLASGDRFAEAVAQIAAQALPLLVLTVVVSVPLALALTDFVTLLLVVAWIALTGFSIPVAMLERNPDSDSSFAQLGYSMTRAVALARAEYLHALGVVAALAGIYVFAGGFLATALAGFAENRGFGAFLLVQIVLAPFFFLGLSVLYFEQKARALSSRPKQ